LWFDEIPQAQGAVDEEGYREKDQYDGFLYPGIDRFSGAFEKHNTSIHVKVTDFMNKCAGGTGIVQEVQSKTGPQPRIPDRGRIGPQMGPCERGRDFRRWTEFFTRNAVLCQLNGRRNPADTAHASRLIFGLIFDKCR
jgi:hypothetical protein